MQTGTDRANDVGALVGAVIQRMWKPMFKKHQSTWDREALMVRGLELADVAVRTFDAGKGAQLSTWISLVVWRGLKTEHRTCEREAARNRTHGETRQYLSEGRRFEDVDETLPVGEYINSIYIQAVHTVGREPSGRGTRCYEPAQEAALMALKNRMKLSNRGVIFFLAERPKLVSTMRLSRLPSFRKIDRLCDRFSRVAANKRVVTRMAKDLKASPYITEEAAAALVGLSHHTLKGWRLNERSPFTVYKPGGAVRYKRTDVEAWMEAQAVRPAEGAKVA